jgi:mono/diheme cytochrome c family protein
MTGMPAWKHRMTDEEVWAIVSLVRELPRLSPEESDLGVTERDARDIAEYLSTLR